MQNTALRSVPPALPATAADLLQKRDMKSHPTLNDKVESHYLALFEDEQFRGYLYAVWDEQAVEGSCAVDNVKAAEMIRRRAQETGDVEVSKQKLATLVKSLNVVLRRYHESRNERRNMIAGEIVPNDRDE